MDEKDAKYIIDVNNLLGKDVGEREIYQINLKARILDESFKLTEPISGKIELTNVGKKILAKVHINTGLTLFCARCLKEFSNLTNLDYIEEFACENNTNCLINTDNNIDIWPSIRENIILSVPMKSLCQENCRGISKRSNYG